MRASGGDIFATLKAQGRMVVLAGFLAGLLAVGLVWDAQAQDLTGLARVDGAASGIADEGEAVAAQFILSQPVPWRVRVLDDPPRLILEDRKSVV